MAIFGELIKKLPRQLSIDSPIEDIVAWAFTHIYSKRYPDDDSSQILARLIHGIEHVTRAAIYAPIFVNLRRKYGDQASLALTQLDIKYLMIALVFHDSGREGEGEDKWDNDSAANCFYFLRDVLGVDEQKAVEIAEAIANKDIKNNTYQKLIIKFDKTVGWQEQPIADPSNYQKTIYQQIIHDADCLDIIRARELFEGERLDFYQQIAKHNPGARNDIAHMICEARSLIHHQGDQFDELNLEVKQHYEHQGAFKAIIADIDDPKQRDALGYRYLRTLFNGGLLVEPQTSLDVSYPSDPRETIDYRQAMASELPDYIDGRERSPSTTSSSATSPIPTKIVTISNEQLRHLLDNHQVFSRSVGSPSDFKQKSSKPPESLASIEIRKAFRIDEKGKLRGNPRRSISLIGYGAEVFADAGFLILKADTKRIHQISKVDCGSGHSNKKHLLGRSKVKDAAKELKILGRINQLGGSLVGFADIGSSKHNEILYDLYAGDFSAIYYSREGNLFNKDILHQKKPKHFNSPILQAVFIRQQHYQQTGILLSIVEYSAVHNTLVNRQFDAKAIKDLWLTMTRDYVAKKIKKGNYSFLNQSLEQLKIHMMYEGVWGQDHLPADALYPTELQRDIDAEIQAIVEEIKEETLREAEIVTLDSHYIYQNAEKLVWIRDSVSVHTQSCIQQAVQSYFENNFEEMLNKSVLIYPGSFEWCAKKQKCSVDAYLIIKSLLESHLRNKSGPLSTSQTFTAVLTLAIAYGLSAQLQHLSARLVKELAYTSDAYNINHLTGFIILTQYFLPDRHDDLAWLKAILSSCCSAREWGSRRDSDGQQSSGIGRFNLRKPQIFVLKDIVKQLQDIGMLTGKIQATIVDQLQLEQLNKEILTTDIFIANPEFATPLVFSRYLKLMADLEVGDEIIQSLAARYIYNLTSIKRVLSKSTSYYYFEILDRDELILIWLKSGLTDEAVLLTLIEEICAHPKTDMYYWDNIRDDFIADKYFCNQIERISMALPEQSFSPVMLEIIHNEIQQRQKYIRLGSMSLKNAITNLQHYRQYPFLGEFPTEIYNVLLDNLMKAISNNLIGDVIQLLSYLQVPPLTAAQATNLSVFLGPDLDRFEDLSDEMKELCAARACELDGILGSRSSSSLTDDASSDADLNLSTQGYPGTFFPKVATKKFLHSPSGPNQDLYQSFN